MKRQKSISSQAASISAWSTVFDWLSIVAALMRSRQGPASRSAARRKTAARSFQGMACQVLRAAVAPAGGEPINLGSGVERSVAEVAEAVAAACGFSGRLRWDPSRPTGQRRRVLDTSRARDRLGFEASTDFEAGLKRTVAWYRQRRPG